MSGWEGILAEGEEILWQGQPEPGVTWAKLISLQTFIGAFFTVFSVFWMGGAAMVATGIGIIGVLFPLFGLPFLLIGLHMLIGHLFWDAYMRQRTWYSVSDRSAFVARNGLLGRTLDSYPILAMDDLGLKDGVPGDVTFGKLTHIRPKQMHVQRGPRHTTVTHEAIGFFNIAEARAVYRLLRDRRHALRQEQRATTDPSEGQ